ncbi:MAG: AtpZ/AtpI family protein [Halanaerobiales bacterium]|nr:AtpZ/AtpI family protein [Halanaerobiales bacterium]
MKKEDWHKILRTMGLLTQLGIVILVNIGLGFFIGLKFDQWLDFNYLFKIVGLLVGVGSGFYSDYKIIESIIKDQNEN